jgi:hypothetical protein
MTIPTARELARLVAAGAGAQDELIDAVAALGVAALDDQTDGGPGWGLWTDWAWAAGIVPCPATPTELNEFLAFIDDEHPAMLCQAIEAIRERHAEAGLPDPFTATEPPS